MKLIFWMKINIKLSYRLILLFLEGIPRHAQHNKFAKSLWYLKKEVGDIVEFLCKWASKFSINWCYHFWWAWSGMPKILKISSMQCLYNISRQNWAMKLMFCILISIKTFTRRYYYFWWGGLGMPKVPGQAWNVFLIS